MFSRPTMRKGRRLPKKKAALAFAGDAPLASPAGGSAAAALAKQAQRRSLRQQPSAACADRRGPRHGRRLPRRTGPLRAEERTRAPQGHGYGGRKIEESEDKEEKAPAALKLSAPSSSAISAKRPPSAAKLSRTKSRRGFGRLALNAPMKTPKAPSQSNAFSSSKKKARKKQAPLRISSVGRVGTFGGSVSPTLTGENYIVAKVADSSDPERIQFQGVDWKLNNGLSVNEHYGRLSENSNNTFYANASDVGPRIEGADELNQTYSDMTCLPVVHRSSVLHNLRMRYIDGGFQTAIGSILCIINPFEYHPEVYGMDVVHQYTDAKEATHLASFHHTCTSHKRPFEGSGVRGNQAIVISGSQALARRRQRRNASSI